MNQSTALSRMALESQGHTRQDMLDLMDPRMSDDRGHQYTSRNGNFDSRRKSYVSPSVQDEYQEELYRPARMPSPPMSETSNPPSMEQQTGFPAEVIAQITAQIKKDVVEHFKQSGNIETLTEHLKPETVTGVESNADETKSEPMVRVPSSDKSCSTPSPPPSVERVYTPPSPNVGARRTAINSDSPPLSPVRSPPASPTVEKPSVRFMNPRNPVEKDANRSARAAAYAASVSTELTAVDLKWGTLFDVDLNPTPRLREFLKGLANRIISDYDPRKSIVVTPDKMAAFYTDYSIDNEVYPLISIFESQSHENLSVLYQELYCQHHFVQEEPSGKPTIPGLTPEGFAQWVAIWILAYPEQEAKRLEKIVVGMAIDADGENIDGKPERLPKQISRHLLPAREDSRCRKDIKGAICNFLEDLGISRTRKPSITNSPTSRRLSASTQPNTRPVDTPQMNSAVKVTERDDLSYSKSPPELGAVKEPAKIERHRQPYAAKPGSDRVYADTLAIPNAPRDRRAYSTGRSSRDHEPEPEHRIKPSRSQSNTINEPTLKIPRSNSSRRPRSPSYPKFTNPNPFEIDTGGSYHPETFNSTPKQSQPLSPPSYTTEPDKRDRDRDYDRYEDYRRSERRSNTDQSRSRRNTVTDPSRLPSDITTPRNIERWDQMNENRDRNRNKDRASEPRSAGPILHQESRSDRRASEYDSPGEEYYLRPPMVPPRSRECDVERGAKYYDRRYSQIDGGNVKSP